MRTGAAVRPVKSQHVDALAYQHAYTLSAPVSGRSGLATHATSGEVICKIESSPSSCVIDRTAFPTQLAPLHVHRAAVTAKVESASLVTERPPGGCTRAATTALSQIRNLHSTRYSWGAAAIRSRQQPQAPTRSSCASGSARSKLGKSLKIVGQAADHYGRRCTSSICLRCDRALACSFGYCSSELARAKLTLSFQEGADDNKNKPTYIGKQGEDARSEQPTALESAEVFICVDVSEVRSSEAAARLLQAQPACPAQHGTQDQCLLHPLQCVLAYQRRRTTGDFATMNAVLETTDSAAPATTQANESEEATRRAHSNSLDNQLSLQRASLILRAIRQRYEAGRNAHPYARCYSVQVVMDYGDMAWISAAIDALEKTIAAGATEL